VFITVVPGTSSNIEFVYVKGPENEFSDWLSREAGATFAVEVEKLSLPEFD
jgi:hypothetical protein